MICAKHSSTKSVTLFNILDKDINEAITPDITITVAAGAKLAYKKTALNGTAIAAGTLNTDIDFEGH